MVNGVFELRISATVDAQVLRENVDGLVSGPTEPVREDVPRVAVLHSVVVQSSGIVLGARGRIRALVQVRLGDCDASAGHHGNTVVARVNVGAFCPSAWKVKNKIIVDLKK